MAIEPAADAFADAARVRAIRLIRAEAGVDRRVLRELKRLERTLVATLAASNLDGADGLTSRQRARLEALLAQVTPAVQASSAAQRGVVEPDLERLAATEARWTQRSLSRAIKVEFLTVGLTEAQVRAIVSDVVVMGLPASEWWDLQPTRFKSAFGAQMRMGLQQGETNAQLINRIRGTRAQGFQDGLMAIERRHAEALVRSSVQAVANEARVRTYQANDDVVKGYVYQATLDSRTSQICAGLDGLTWTLDQEPVGHDTNFQQPPVHWNCRSTLLPWLKSWRELDVDADELPPGTKASMDGQVPSDQTFEQFLQRQEEKVGPQFADDLLGKGKADLWRRGEVTLRQMVDQRGRPLSLAQLERLS